MQNIHDPFPCPINSTTTACTLFAATDQSWEALAAFVGVDISTFEALPVVNPVRSLSSHVLRLIRFVNAYPHVYSQKRPSACLAAASRGALQADTVGVLICAKFVLQLMRYQVIPNAVLTPSQLLNGISYSTALPNEFLTVSLQQANIIVSCWQHLRE